MWKARIIPWQKVFFGWGSMHAFWKVRKHRCPCLAIPQKNTYWIIGEVRWINSGSKGYNMIRGVKISLWKWILWWRTMWKRLSVTWSIWKTTDYLMNYDLCSSSFCFLNISNSSTFIFLLFYFKFFFYRIYFTQA